MGRKIENVLKGITLKIEQEAESPGALNTLIYLIINAQLNIQNERIFLLYIRKMLMMKETHMALFVAPTEVGNAHLALDLL